MKNKKQNIILEDQQDNFLFKKTKSNLNISFNRVSFIFFYFFCYFFNLLNTFSSSWIKKTKN